VLIKATSCNWSTCIKKNLTSLAGELKLKQIVVMGLDGQLQAVTLIIHTEYMSSINIVLMFLISSFAELAYTNTFSARQHSMRHHYIHPLDLSGKSRRRSRKTKTKLRDRYWAPKWLHTSVHLEAHYSVVTFCFPTTWYSHIQSVFHI
jgi:hypothetical protein